MVGRTHKRDALVRKLNAATDDYGWWDNLMFFHLPRLVAGRSQIKHFRKLVENDDPSDRTELKVTEPVHGDGHVKTDVCPYLCSMYATYLNTQINLIEEGLAEVEDVRISWYPAGSWLFYHYDPKFHKQIADNEGEKNPIEGTGTRGVFPIGGSHVLRYKCPGQGKGGVCLTKALSRRTPYTKYHKNGNVNREEVEAKVGSFDGSVWAFAGLSSIHSLPFYHWFEQEDLVEEGFCAVADFRHRRGSVEDFRKKLDNHVWTNAGMPRWESSAEAIIDENDIEYLLKMVVSLAPDREEAARKAEMERLKREEAARKKAEKAEMERFHREEAARRKAEMERLMERLNREEAARKKAKKAEKAEMERLNREEAARRKAEMERLRREEAARKKAKKAEKAEMERLEREMLSSSSRKWSLQEVNARIEFWRKRSKILEAEKTENAVRHRKLLQLDLPNMYSINALRYAELQRQKAEKEFITGELAAAKADKQLITGEIPASRKRPRQQ